MAKRKTKTPDPPKPRQAGPDDDSFGLPEIEPQPLNQLPEPPAEPVASHTPPAEEPVAEAPAFTAGDQVEFTRPATAAAEPPPRSPQTPFAIVAGIVVVLLAMGGLVYWFVLKPNQEKARQELLAKQEQQRQEEERRAIAEEERRRREAAEAEAKVEVVKPTVGVIDTLTERSRRYYVVLASSIDADLIMDYAKRLSAQGTSTKILPPFNQLKFTRLTMGEYDSYASAQAAADAAKAEFGNNLWVIRY
jgi:hypothetical protein